MWTSGWVEKKPYRIFINEELAVKVIMNCTKTATHKFRTTLGFKQYHVILAEVQSLVAKIMTSFEGENMQTV